MKKSFVILLVISVFLLVSCTTKLPVLEKTVIDAKPLVFDRTVSFDWESVGEGATYEIQYKSDGDVSSRGDWITLEEVNTTSYTWETTGFGTFMVRIIAKKGGVSSVSDPFTFEVAQTKDNLSFVITDYNSGSAVKDAYVLIFNDSDDTLIGSGLSDENGEIVASLKEIAPKKIDAIFKKKGHAVTKIDGLLSVQAKDLFPTSILPSMLSANPENETAPRIDVEYTDLFGDPLDLTLTATQNFNVTIRYLEGQTPVWRMFDPVLNRLPGYSSGASVIQYATNATVEVSIDGQHGLTAINYLVYDSNKNKLHKIDYINIDKEDTPLPALTFTPYTFSDDTLPGIPNLLSLTRRTGGNYSLTTERTGPDGAGLFIDLFWVDASSMNFFHENNLLPLPVEGTVFPDGYYVYRSFDNAEWEKLAFVSADEISGNAMPSWIDFYYHLYLGVLDTEGEAESIPMFRDRSPLLEPGKEVWYRVASVYGNNELAPVELGSVVPLDTFNVELLNPEDNERNTSRNPEFSWRANKALTSPEGDVYYNYYISILDQVQSNNGMIMPMEDNSAALLGEVPHLFSSTDTDASVTFTGSAEVGNPYNWKFYDYEYTWTIAPYEADRLEVNKTYNWGLPLAYASVRDSNSLSYSIVNDYQSGYRGTPGWGVDAYSIEQDIDKDFTTGLN